MTLDPVAVALKFGFIAVLYLFLLWMARSALKDLRNTAGAGAAADGRGGGAPAYEDATGMHVASSGLGGDGDQGAPRLRVETAAGLRDGVAYDLSDGAVLGRGDQSDIQLEDSFASTSHARLLASGGRRGAGGSRLDQRDLPERGAAARSATTPRGRPDPHR